MPDSRSGLAKSDRRISDRRGPTRAASRFPVVGVGASAGGLEAATKLIDALPNKIGMAFILVQHLDPSHKSMLVDLLAAHTSMTVHEAADGTPIEPEHLYIIPPGRYLSVGGGVLRLTASTGRRGARMPFDVLLQSLAETYGVQAMCVVLSGTGDDGSAGLRAIRRAGGFVIVQEPGEASQGGMPRSAIETGEVDLVLPVAEIAAALIDRNRTLTGVPGHDATLNSPGNLLAEILALLGANTVHDFDLYKRGTLQRRIERRMAMASIRPNDMGRYLAILQDDRGELDRLAKDLLIHVTGFFRDPDVFKLLEDTVIPELLARLPADRQIRVWIAGCSTGEEAYSIAMLFRERMGETAAASVRLQVFASDIDPDAISVAREGFYPSAIRADLSPERLARFFVLEEQGYRVLPELRASVVFTVQDILSDPPFSRLDLISCRNLMIYLGAAGQAKIVSLFHFALNTNGILLLGNVETIGEADDRFELVSKPARVFRHVGRKRPGDIDFAAMGGAIRLPSRLGQGEAPSRRSVLAGLCSRFLMETHAPATIISNSRHEYLYSVGPTDRYLRVAPGQPTHDLLTMVREDTRIRLRLAIEQALQENARVTVPGGRTSRDGRPVPFAIEVQPVLCDGETLLLICFVDQTGPERIAAKGARPRDAPRIAELERELETTRAELDGAIRNLDVSSQEQKAINEEALSVNEEFQSTNEELLTSKEELQSLNEELTALNSQLQETLEQQRTTSDDLQNVLYSTDVATLFLDTELNIRFFTPATRSLFNIIRSDVGRPLADLHSLAGDALLTTDAREVLKDQAPVEREIETAGGTWFRRRILPYRAHDGGVEGVVITFNDISRRKQAAKALEAAKLEAERANTAKSRFLAAASHDLRQPLQTLALLQGLLASGVEGESNQRLVVRLDQTLGAMSGMLNTLLDINQIEAGFIQPIVEIFAIGPLLDRLRDEFGYLAQAQGLSLRMVPCSLSVRSDPRLLEQMLRNLLSNALKYTRRGKVLLGCRRRQGLLSIEVWDTGVGIAERDLQAIFEEYHQVDNPARERSRGLGLGLSIVQRLGALLQHRVRVRSYRGKGSQFAIEIGLPPSGTVASVPPRVETKAGLHEPTPLRAVVLVVEDDPEVRELLGLMLDQDGFEVHTAPDGAAALALVERGDFEPELILSDYNLPHGMDGLETVARLRVRTQRPIPALILTGDISADTLGAITDAHCAQLAKPVRLVELTQAIRQLLHAPASADHGPDRGRVFVVDDDGNIRQAVRTVLEQDGRTVEDYAAGEAFLAAYRPGRGGCLLVDAYLPGMSGLDLLQRLRAAGDRLPAIMITGRSDVQMVVEAMRAGVSDFIEKPIAAPDLVASIARAFAQSDDTAKLSAWQSDARVQLSGLTPRQRQIMGLVLAGHPSKNIAADIGISQRTVENHRASIMRKTGAGSLPALARLALAAGEAASPAATTRPQVAR